MIIDAHGHTVAPAALYEYQGKLVSRRAPMKGPELSDDMIAEKLAEHVGLLDEVGTDMQLISPRPYAAMHSLFNARVSQTWTGFVNDTIYRQVTMRPDRFRGVAGLPQFRVDSLEQSVAELDRCVTQLGFVGCLLNPDPLEGEGNPPGLGERYWYPLYEKLCELDVPALVHSASCSSERESYSVHFINEETIAILSLLSSKVFTDFPDLKLVIGHGGGAVPYQLGRFRAHGYRGGGSEDFLDRLRLLNFDTCIYSRESLELLFRVVGPANCLFGTERPGTGAAVDPTTGRMIDDLKPVVDAIEFLSDDDRHLIYEANVTKLYHLTGPISDGSN